MRTKNSAAICSATKRVVKNISKYVYPVFKLKGTMPFWVQWLISSDNFRVLNLCLLFVFDANKSPNPRLIDIVLCGIMDFIFDFTLI